MIDAPARSSRDLDGRGDVTSGTVVIDIFHHAVHVAFTGLASAALQESSS